jgi:hypothetical protein
MHKTAVILLLTALFLTSTLTAIKTADSTTTTPRENTWTQKAPMQQERCDLGVVSVDGKIYAIGGIAACGIVGTNEVYDPKTDMWTNRTAMPTARYGFAITVYQDKIYCIGGCTGTTAENGQTLTSANEVYDPATDTWESKDSLPIERLESTADAVNGKIYVLGGYPNTTQLEIYDPPTDSWSMKSTGDFQPFGPSCVYEGKIYTIWGWTHIYDPLIDNWSYGSPQPQMSEGSSGIGMGLGITSGVIAPVRIYTFDPITQVYDPQTDNWFSGVAIPTMRDASAVATVDDLIYVIGGFSMNNDLISGPQTTYYATNEQYTPFGYGTVTALDSSGSFPITPVVIACGVAIAAFCVGVAVFYSRKRKIKRSM